MIRIDTPPVLRGMTQEQQISALRSYLLALAASLETQLNHALEEVTQNGSE